MNEMIERVARAIFFRDGPQDDEMWQHMQPHLREGARASARAAIEAMREPTSVMVDAGDDLCPVARGTESYVMSGRATPEEVWQAMIDSVLSDTLEKGEVL